MMFVNGKVETRLNKILLEADSLRAQTVRDLSKANDAYNRAEIDDVQKLRQLKNQWIYEQNNKLSEIRDRFYSEIDNVREDLAAKAFAPTASDRAEFRSVYNELSQLKDRDEIERKYADAKRFADSPAQKAAVARAADLGIRSITDDYKKRNENFAKHADQLLEFNEGANDLTAKMAVKMRLTSITEPPLKRKEVNFGFTNSANGDRVPYFRPAFYYEDNDAPDDNRDV
jgi:hypothetical protein